MPITSKNLNLVIKHAQTLEGRALLAIATALQRGLLITVGVAQTEFLSGPRPAKLDVRSTRLRASINSKVEILPDRIRGHIGSNMPYAGFHEFGYHGLQRVKAHTRIVQVLDAKGNPIQPQRREYRDASKHVIGYRDSVRKAAARVQGSSLITEHVKAHNRKVNYPGRPFLRPALTKCEPIILAEIRKELATL
jgi:phage gpG-like protein